METTYPNPTKIKTRQSEIHEIHPPPCSDSLDRWLLNTGRVLPSQTRTGLLWSDSSTKCTCCVWALVSDCVFMFERCHWSDFVTYVRARSASLVFVLEVCAFERCHWSDFVTIRISDVSDVLVIWVIRLIWLKFSHFALEHHEWYSWVVWLISNVHVKSFLK